MRDEELDEALTAAGDAMLAQLDAHTDVEGGLAKLHATFDAEVLPAARVYLQHGPAGTSELVRVLGQHLDVQNAAGLLGSLQRLTAAGHLSTAGTMVSLPTGDR